MAENPFQPPKAEPDEHTRSELPPGLPGGRGTITAVAVLAGVLGLAIGFFARSPGASQMALFGMPFVLSFFSTAFCILALRNLPMSSATQWSVIAVVTMATYVLFFPICTAGGFAATAVGMSQMYGPSPPGLALAVLLGSVVAFNITLPLAIRWIKRRATKNKPETEAE